MNSHFLDLHHSERPLLMPNPWDVGSAKLLESIGFKALATTSGGFAATLRRLDGAQTREGAVAHIGQQRSDALAERAVALLELAALGEEQPALEALEHSALFSPLLVALAQ